MPFDNDTKPAPRFAFVVEFGGTSDFPVAVKLVNLDGTPDGNPVALFPTLGAAKDYATYINEGLLEDSLGTGLSMAQSVIEPLLSALPSLFSQLKPRGDVGGTGDTQQQTDGHKDANPQPAEPTAAKPPFLTLRKNKMGGGYDVFGMGLNGWKDDTLVQHFDYEEDAVALCVAHNPNSSDIVTLRKARGGDTYAAYVMDTDGWKGNWPKLRDFGTDKAAAEAFATERNRAALGLPVAETA